MFCLILQTCMKQVKRRSRDTIGAVDHSRMHLRKRGRHCSLVLARKETVAPPPPPPAVLPPARPLAGSFPGSRHGSRQQNVFIPLQWVQWVTNSNPWWRGSWVWRWWTPKTRASYCFRFTAGSGVRRQTSAPVSLTNSPWEGGCVHRQSGGCDPSAIKSYKVHTTCWWLRSAKGLTEAGHPEHLLQHPWVSVWGWSLPHPWDVRELTHFRVTGCGMVTDWWMKYVAVCCSLSVMMHKRPLWGE